MVLYQNYPNPFNPSTTIKYELPRTSQVNLSVFDILGREVSLLVNDKRDAGVYEVKFDGSNLASGVYVYRLMAGGVVQSRKLMILK
jgi:glucuronoarabinoxylan endo-1,4-beta-xylanase